ncbi:MAG: Minf_1886 family protein [Verrucomicrobiota bacterium]
MQAVHFEQSVLSILNRDKRVDAQAYFFLKDALDFTLKRIAEANQGQTRHVSGPELLAGFRDLALEQFGPMAATLMTEWGIRQCGDIGDMVFHLIEEQIFGRQESDCKEDFAGSFDFEESLRVPFLPQRHRPSATPHSPPVLAHNPGGISTTTKNLENS